MRPRLILAFASVLAGATLLSGSLPLGLFGSDAPEDGPRAAPTVSAPTGPTSTGPALIASSPSPSARVVPAGETRIGVLPPVVDNGPRTGDRVALTFDADMTDSMLKLLESGQVRSYANIKIIELLERDRIPATFFLTGKWVRRYPEITARLAGNPRFELANHTFGHLAFTPSCYHLPPIAAGEMTEDVAKTFRIIEPYGGRQTRYFRFPGLCHDDAALRALAPIGLTVVDGDVISGDPFATASQPIVDAVLSRVRPGSIVVMHITEANAQYTDEALPLILAGLQDRGLRPATLSETLA